MTEDKKAIRLSKAAREFNVGIQTIVEFLHKKGFDISHDPNGKIPPEAYALIVKEYSSDLSVKKDAEKLALKEKITPKKSLSIEDMESGREGDNGEPDEDFLITDISGVKKHIDLRTEIRKPEIRTVGKVDLTPPVRPVQKVPEAPVEKAPAAAAHAPEPAVTTTTEAPVTAETPEIPAEPRQPKVVGRVDLDKLVKPEKPSKKAAGKKTEAAPEVKKQEPAAPRPEPEPVKAAPEPEPQVTQEPKETEIFRPGYEKLAGPKMVGKIELVPEVKKSRDQSAADKHRHDKKRERIKPKPREKVALDTPVAPPQQEARKDKKGPQKDHRGGDRKKSFRALRPEVDREDVDKNIRDVNLLMSKSKSKVAKYRRDKRDAISQRMKDETEKKELEKSVLKVTEFVSVNEMATMMDVPVVDIISTCMSLGLIVSINQRLDAETMALVAEEFGFTVEFVSAELQEAVKEEEDDETNLQPRPPIVTVMGHVDHGKTKLLDYIRNTNVVAGEAGGITQHIGAYTVTLEGEKTITFLDTPGHEAFTAMRARGAQITDIVIIVVAADDGVMPQTREAINHAHAAGVPIIFAINKIDKPTANPDRIREELANMNFLVEEWGGKYQSQEISAKSGINIDLLLEKILLQAEMLELKANPDKLAIGTVLESSLDKGRGFVATMLVKAGTLNVGDVVIAGSCFGHVKAMYNERNQKITEAGPSMPVLILGLNGAPQAGDKFNVMESDKEAKDIATKRAQLQREQGLRTQKHITLDEIGRRIAIGNFQELNIIVKGDVDGSVEALSDSLIKLSTEEIQVNIIHKAVGQISESDILLAAASNAVVVGFQVRPSLSARKLAEKEGIDIRLYSIIYDAIEEIRAAMEGMLSPEIKEEIVATVEVREVFRIGKVGTVAGCFVRDGKITRNTRVRVIRDGIVIYTGDLGSLKRFKDDVREVTSGYECGLNIDNFNDIKVGDVIEGYQTVQVKKTL
ncbi:MAG: translation initiation factor IF-2 [Bacteroidales bacterium]|jgi:translation initiation factor IF-2|nr:translation initiation factor IF-2 [Bacteroidales bacterium]MDX9927376.1 translation initiation factor IF-2 [Bacteroidales bacterium]HNX83425.1 translation initiation factor IF-2 [Bacteroidales bacterium]HPS97645.1 translation initiation factor IF-2 [Bacteroidales bacterium]